MTPFAALIPAIRACVAACTIAVTPGTYPALDLSQIAANAVTVDFTGSTLAGLQIVKSSGITINAGTWGAGGVQVVDGGFVNLDDIECEFPHGACWSFTRSHDFNVLGGATEGEGSDGGDIAGSQRGTVRGFTLSSQHTDLGPRRLHPGLDDPENGHDADDPDLRHPNRG